MGKKSVMFFAFCTIFLMGVSITSATTFTESGTYTVAEGDRFSLQNDYSKRGDPFVVTIDHVDLDPRDDSWYQYTGEPRVSFGARTILVLHEGQSGKMGTAPAGPDVRSAVSITVHSIDVDAKETEITIKNLLIKGAQNNLESQAETLEEDRSVLIWVALTIILVLILIIFYLILKKKNS